LASTRLFPETTRMTKSDWKTLGSLGALIGAIVMLHGISSKEWKSAHTIGSILTIASLVGPRLSP